MILLPTGGSASLTYINGTLNGNVTTSNTCSNFGYVTLTAGTWIIFYRIGLTCSSGSGTVNYMEAYMNTTSTTSNLTTNGFCNESSAFTTSITQQHTRMNGSYVVITAVSQTYYINQIINWTGTMQFNRGGQGLSYMYAVKIA